MRNETEVMQALAVVGDDRKNLAIEALRLSKLTRLMMAQRSDVKVLDRYRGRQDRPQIHAYSPTRMPLLFLLARTLSNRLALQMTFVLLERLRSNNTDRMSEGVRHTVPAASETSRRQTRSGLTR